MCDFKISLSLLAVYYILYKNHHQHQCIIITQIHSQLTSIFNASS